MELLEELGILQNFKFLKAETGWAETSINGVKDREVPVIIMTFVNDKNVAIDISIIEMEVSVGEPYAVDDEFKPLKGENNDRLKND